MFACGYCLKEFKYESEKKRHEISHNPQFECVECLKKFSFVSALRRHQKQHKRSGTVQCSECHRNFRDDTLLKRHIKYAHKETHVCSKCEAKFNSQQALLSHQKTHKPKSERRYHCNYNGCVKTFNFPHHLKHHELTHSSEKQHYCSSCGKGFIQLHHLKTHLKKHKPDSWLTCNLPGCLKMFTNDYALKRHMATHKHVKSPDDYDLFHDYKITTPNSIEDKNNDLEQYIEDEKASMELFKRYQLLEDLSIKKSKVGERLDNIQNEENYSVNSSNLNIISSINKSNKNDSTCQGCDCAKIESMNKNMPELKYNSDGTIKIKEFIDVDIKVIKSFKNEIIEEKTDLCNYDVPYNSCKAVLGKCIVSGTGTISENCLCAKMAIDDSPMIYHEISELTPIPCQM